MASLIWDSFTVVYGQSHMGLLHCCLWPVSYGTPSLLFMASTVVCGQSHMGLLHFSSLLHYMHVHAVHGCCFLSTESDNSRQVVLESISAELEVHPAPSNPLTDDKDASCTHPSPPPTPPPPPPPLPHNQLEKDKMDTEIAQYSKLHCNNVQLPLAGRWANVGALALSSSVFQERLAPSTGGGRGRVSSLTSITPASHPREGDLSNSHAHCIHQGHTHSIHQRHINPIKTIDEVSWHRNSQETCDSLQKPHKSLQLSHSTDSSRLGERSSHILPCSLNSMGEKSSTGPVDIVTEMRNSTYYHTHLCVVKQEGHLS